MKKIKLKVTIIVMFFIAIIFWTNNVEAAVPKLNKTSVYIKKGKTRKITVKNTKKKVKWYSSNKKIAVVSNGKIKAKKSGQTVITAKVGNKKYRCKVNVYPKWLIGSWYTKNYDRKNDWATSYKTTFATNGKTVVNGYRDTDRGTFRVINEKEVIANYNNNTTVFPQYGETKVDNYKARYQYNSKTGKLKVKYIPYQGGNATNGWLNKK